MARKPRIHLPGSFYHVILRGNGGDPIFFDDRDRYRLYLFLQYAVEKFRCRIHAFCLMRNHIHLVVQVEEVPLSRIMQNVSQRFTTWINFTRGRTGHLFQGRYKALLIEADSYLLELVRYVHLNPVRAGVCAAAGEYPWSGHRAYLGQEHLPWLTTSAVLAMLAPGKTQARKAYVSFVRDGEGEGRRGEFLSGTCEGRILGTETFVDDTLVRVNQKGDRQFSLDEVVAAVCTRYGISGEQMKAPGKVRPMTEARAVAAAIVRQALHLKLMDLGRLLNRDVSALGKVAQHAAANERVSKVACEIVAHLREPGRMSETPA